MVSQQYGSVGKEKKVEWHAGICSLCKNCIACRDMITPFSFRWIANWGREITAEAAF
jgi:hypothetical protein